MDISKSTAWRPGAAVCRCCLTEGCYKDISTEYFWMGQKEVYSEMLLHTFDVTISYAQSGGPNSQSRLICDGCISRLREASEFKKQVQQCEKTFMEHLDGGASSNIVLLGADSDPVKIGEEAVKIEDVKVERLHSDDDVDGFADQGGFDDNDGFDSDLDDEPLTKLATKKPKKEKEVELDIPEPPKTTKRKSVIKLKGTASKKAKTKKAETGESSKTKVAKEKKKGTIRIGRIKFSTNYADERKNAVTIIENSNVCPFKWRRGRFGCLFCAGNYGDVIELKEHVSEHKNRPDLLKRVRLDHNEPVKIEVRQLRCELCFESLKDIDTLKSHLAEAHDTLIDDKFSLGVLPFCYDNEIFVCTHCDESYESFTKMNNHMNLHLPNIICSECGKPFMTTQRHKAHIKAAHTPAKKPKGPYKRQTYKCPYCCETFKDFLDRSKHLKALHNKKIEFPCHLCPSVFLLHGDRTKHIQLIHTRDKEFCCKICPYKTVTAAQLKYHMVKHGGERKYLCEICIKTFPRRNALRRHMKLHTNDKKLICEVCSAAFIQKTSLVSHMRTHHPILNQ